MLRGRGRKRRLAKMLRWRRRPRFADSKIASAARPWSRCRRFRAFSGVAQEAADGRSHSTGDIIATTVFCRGFLLCVLLRSSNIDVAKHAHPDRAVENCRQSDDFSSPNRPSLVVKLSPPDFVPSRRRRSDSRAWMTFWSRRSSVFILRILGVPLGKRGRPAHAIVQFPTALLPLKKLQIHTADEISRIKGRTDQHGRHPH